MTPDIFAPMASAKKREFLRCYLEHLQEHDGEVDGERRFPRREAALRAIVDHPILLVGAPPVDQDTFDRHNQPGRIEGDLDRASLWAVTTAKANLSERYAMELQLAMSARKPFDRDDPESFIDIEEQYHTRILADALAAIGIRASFGVPPLATRLLIAVMIRLPRSVANVVILAAELGGVVLFQLLLEHARMVFAHEARALARIEDLLAQVLADEIGHVLYVRSRLGRVRLWLAQKLAMPIVARLLRYVAPEMPRLFGEHTLRERMAAVDLAELRRIHPQPFAADAMFAAHGLAPLPVESATGTG